MHYQKQGKNRHGDGLNYQYFWPRQGCQNGLTTYFFFNFSGIIVC